MKILALDFSNALRSIALFESEEGEWYMLHSITETLRTPDSPLDMIKSLEGVQPDQIEGIVIGLGPGSYTGIRSALSIAQGWNLARNTPAVGVSSADVIALSATLYKVTGEIEVVIDAQRNEVYSACYHVSDNSITQTSALEILQKPRTDRIVGPDVLRWNPKGIVVQPNAWALGTLGVKLKFGPPELLEPIYLRETSFVKAPAVRHA